jgi:integrase
MPTIKSNMVGALRPNTDKPQEDYWLEGAVAGLSNLRLGVRVSRTGTKKWMARYRVGGRGSKDRRLMLGTYGNPKDGFMDYKNAVKEACKIHIDTDDGLDPAAEKKHETRKRLTGGKDVAWLLDEWIKRHCDENVKSQTTENYRQILTTHLLPQCVGMPIASITKRDIIDVLDKIKDEASAGMAERVRLYASAMFNWAASEDIIDVPPTYALKARAKIQSRERVLSDDEVRAVWKACGEYRRGESSYGPFIRMLIITGQRRSEIAAMCRQDINLDKVRYTIPAERNKSGRTHDVPLSAQALRIIKPRLDKNCAHLFPASRARFVDINTPDMILLDKPMSGWGKMKRQLDEMSGVTDWRLHDIRRTVGTNLAELEVPRLTISRILNHKEGGVTSIYDRHSYFKEKLAALELWGRRLDQILTPDGGENVVPLPTRAG